jgi:hypothetical protein
MIGGEFACKPGSQRPVGGALHSAGQVDWRIDAGRRSLVIGVDRRDAPGANNHGPRGVASFGTQYLKTVPGVETRLN